MNEKCKKEDTSIVLYELVDEFQWDSLRDIFQNKYRWKQNPS